MKYRSDPSRIRGSIAPLITPFFDDGSLDLKSVGRLTDWQLNEGTHGISVGGSTGEPTSLSIEERKQVMDAAAAALDDRGPFLPGTGGAKMDETLELTAHADAVGADAVLVVTPYYARPTQHALIQWYGTVAEEFPELPIIVYNVPVRTAVDIAPETVGRLRRAHDNIVGIKETTRDFEHVSHVLNECGTDFLAYSGIELLCYPMLTIGGNGHLSCVANFAPRPVARLYEAFAEGRPDEALRLHYELHELVALAFLETNPVPAKWVMHELGLLPSAFVRPPLAELSAISRDRALTLLERSSLTPDASVAGVARSS